MIPFQAIFNVTGTIYASLGRADRMARACVPITGIMCFAFLVTLVLAAPLPSAIHILAWVYFGTFSLSVLAYTGYAFWIIGLSPQTVLRATQSIWLGSLMMIIVVLGVRGGCAWLGLRSVYILLSVEIVAGMLTYFLVTRQVSLEYLASGVKGLWREPKESLSSNKIANESHGGIRHD